MYRSSHRGECFFLDRGFLATSHYGLIIVIIPQQLPANPFSSQIKYLSRQFVALPFYTALYKEENTIWRK